MSRSLRSLLGIVLVVCGTAIVFNSRTSIGIVPQGGEASRLTGAFASCSDDLVSGTLCTDTCGFKNGLYTRKGSAGQADNAVACVDSHCTQPQTITACGNPLP